MENVGSLCFIKRWTNKASNGPCSTSGAGDKTKEVVILDPAVTSGPYKAHLAQA